MQKEIMRAVFRNAGLGLTVGGVLLCASVRARPQTTTYPSGAGTSTSTGINRSVGVNPYSRPSAADFPTLDPNFSHRQLVARREDLKKHMVDNAARLLMLTHDLQTELQSRPPTESDGKRLDEIAKLARTVRDQMRQ